MKLAENVQREGLRLVLDFEGPCEFAAALAEVIARFEGFVPPAEATEIERPTGSAATQEAPLSPAERCRRWRERRRERVASVSIDTENDTAPCRVDTAERVANVSRVGVAPASLSGSLPSLSPASSSSHIEIESENAREGDTKRHDDTTRNDTAERVANVSRVASPDVILAPWAEGVHDTLRMTLGPPAATIVLAEEWVGFVAYLGSLRASGSPRAICEAEWMGWLRRTWSKARETAQRDAKARASPRPGGRLIQAPLPEQADRFDFSEEANDKRRAERERRKAGT